MGHDTASAATSPVAIDGIARAFFSCRWSINKKAKKKGKEKEGKFHLQEVVETAEIFCGAAEQRAGYVVDYDVNDFKFVTVQGAGHMIPLYKPYFALTMISKFLKNEDF